MDFILKKILIIGILFISASQAFAQWPRFFWEQIEAAPDSGYFAISNASLDGQWDTLLRLVPGFLVLDGDTIATGNNGVAGGLWTNSGGGIYYNGLTGIGDFSGDAYDGNLHIQSGTAGTVAASGSANELTLESGTNSGLSILAPSSFTSNIYLGNETDNFWGGIVADYASDEMYIGTANADADLIFQAGASSAWLTLHDDGLFQFTPITTASQPVGIEGGLYYDDDLDDFYYYDGAAYSPISHWIKDTNDDMYYSAGKIAIGTSTFAGALNVSGNIGTDAGLGNTIMGSGSMPSHSSGNANTVLGYQNLAAATTSNYNTAIGFQNLKAQTAGTGNFVAGFQNLLVATNVSGSTATGSSNLIALLTGNYNTAQGQNNLSKITTGTANTAKGFENGIDWTTGNYNTFLGYQNMYNTTSGDNNTAIGFLNGYTYAGSTAGSVLIGDRNAYLATTLNTIVAQGRENFRNSTNVQFSQAAGIQNARNVSTAIGSFFSGFRTGPYTSTATTANSTFLQGYQTGYNAAEADSMIAIGYQTGYENTYTAPILLGQEVDASVNYHARIGGSHYARFTSGLWSFDVDQDTTSKDGYLLTWNASKGEFDAQEIDQAAASYWTLDGTGIYRDGNVGIGTSGDPGRKFSVDYGAAVSTSIPLFVDGQLDSLTLFRFSNQSTGTSARTAISLSSQSAGIQIGSAGPNTTNNQQYGAENDLFIRGSSGSKNLIFSISSDTLIYDFRFAGSGGTESRFFVAYEGVDFPSVQVADYPTGSAGFKLFDPDTSAFRIYTGSAWETLADRDWVDDNYINKDDQDEGSESNTTDGSGDLTITHNLIDASFAATVTITGTTPYEYTVHTKTASNFKVRFYTVGTSTAATSTAVTFDWIAHDN